MLLDAPGTALRCAEVPVPRPAAGQVLVRVRACGVCRTDLHVIDGELAHPKQPLVPGHEIVGEIAELGDGVERWAIGQRVGIPWLGHTCGVCAYCTSGRENLCDGARFTGYHIDGGYAEYALADARYCLAVPDAYDDVAAAPLLCAGLIGYRSLVSAGDARALGIYGFGAAAHIVSQVARAQGREVYAFTRPGDRAARQFALAHGASWAGDAGSAPPALLDAAIIYAPVGSLVVDALRALRKGGTVVCAGIHMSDIPSFSYDLLWGERSIRSVANLTRRDGEAFLELAPTIPVRTTTQAYPLSRANDALADLRSGQLTGAAVLVPGTQ
ncbi:MAG TPA: zinc-dependent alcohol dehydrogenase family protein [Burkholderiales bacterium]